MDIPIDLDELGTAAGYQALLHKCSSWRRRPAYFFVTILKVDLPTSEWVSP
jgi:hypothetical protein